MLRTLLERLSRRVVLRRAWPASLGGGSVYVSPDAMLKVWTRRPEQIDPELMRAAALLVRPGDRVWDIGANLGLFALAAAHHAGPQGDIWCVEADTWLVGVMRRTALHRPPGGAPLHVLPAAVAREPGIVRFIVARKGRAASFVEAAGQAGRSLTGGARERHQVVGISLDWLAAHTGPPDVVKIDVEGMEIEALLGGRNMLATARPSLYLEVGAEHVPRATEILRAAGYGLFEMHNGSLREVQQAAWNTIAVPPERTETIVGRAAV